MSAGDLKLMQQVEELAGPYLDEFSPTSSAPEAFWAALTANESAGKIGASRFEQAVYRHLVSVASGDQRNYGSITAVTLAGLTDDDIRARATSWGFTQVMGYHTFEWEVPLSVLLDPGQHYVYADKLLRAFVRQFKLDPAADFEAMARCWNAGSPKGKTFDPEYVPNLLARMKIWDSLATPVTGVQPDEPKE